MSLVTVIGTQWGDEGKGKIVDLLAEKADCIARFQGGNNAGHTLVIGGKTYKLNLLPSGIVRDNTVSYIGNGVVVDPFALLNEIKAVEEQGLSVTPSKLVLSPACHMILPVHKLLDQLMEEARGAKSIGTTRKGIGPAYEDKVARRGIRVADLYDNDGLKEKIDAMMHIHNMVITGLGHDALSSDDIYNSLLGIKDSILKFVGNVGEEIHKAHMAKKNILFEGAQGSLLDIDHGTYPYVTSSNTSAGQTGTGTGFGLARKAHIIGLAKAYTTRVGAGPFPTELKNEIGEHLGTVGHEFGTVTGRKRQCGWFDAVLVRYSCDISDIDSIALTKLDVLDDLDEIKICTAYRIDGEILLSMPQTLEEWGKVEPVYETMAGWKTKTAGCRDLDKLPQACRDYVSKLEDLVRRPISIISTSPERDDTILRQDVFA